MRKTLYAVAIVTDEFKEWENLMLPARKRIDHILAVRKRKGLGPFFLSVLLVIAATALVDVQAAQARFKNIEEADTRLESKTTDVLVNADGTFTMTETREFSVQNEKGRRALEFVKIPYTPGLTKVKVLRASATSGGVIMPMPVNELEDHLLSRAPASLAGLADFAAEREIVLPFIGVGANSKTSYVLETQRLRPLVQGVFTMQLAFGAEFPEMRSQVEIKSPKPLYFEIDDPAQYLEVTRVDPVKQDTRGGSSGTALVTGAASTGGSAAAPMAGSAGATAAAAAAAAEASLYKLTIKIKRPVFRQIVDERAVYLKKGTVPTVRVSTAATWNEIVRPLAQNYDIEIAKPLPPFFNDMVKKSAGESSDTAKINRVMGLFNDKVTYQNEWVHPKRILAPHGHKWVVQTKRGNSIDFAVSLAAMMRKLGFRAQVAFVSRGEASDRELRGPALKAPSLEPFNHAVVKWTKADGTLQYLDPSETPAYADGIPARIAGNQALVISESAQTLETIGEDPLSADSLLHLNYQPHGREAALQGDLKLTGSLARAIQQMGLSKGKPALDEEILKWVTHQREQTANSGALPFQYELDNNAAAGFGSSLVARPMSAPAGGANSGAGFGLRFPSLVVTHSPFVDLQGKKTALVPYPVRLDAVPIDTASLNDRASDIYLGPPGTTTEFTQLMFVASVDEVRSSCYVLGEYFDVSRDISHIPGGIEVIDTVKQKKSILTATDARSPEFADFRASLGACLESPTIALAAGNGVTAIAANGAATTGATATASSSTAATSAGSNNASDAKANLELDIGPPVATAQLADALKLLADDRGTWKQARLRLMKARAILTRLLLVDAKNPELYANLAQVTLRLGNPSGERLAKTYAVEAIRLATLATELSSGKSALAYRVRGFAQLNQKNLSEAKKDFALSYKLDPKAAETMGLGGAIAEAGGDIAGAELWYIGQVAAAIPADKIRALETQGSFYMKSGKFDRAEKSYLKEIELQPESIVAWSHLGSAELGAGKTEEAITSDRKALAMGDSVIAKQALSAALAQYAVEVSKTQPDSLAQKPDSLAQKKVESLALESLEYNPENLTALSALTSYYIAEFERPSKKRLDMQKPGRLRRALTYAKRLRKLDPAQAEVELRIRSFIADESSARNKMGKRLPASALGSKKTK